MIAINRKFLKIFIIFIMIGALPPLLTMGSKIKSFSAGVMICSVICIVMCMSQLKRLAMVNRGFFYVFLLLLFYFLIQHLLVGAWQSKSYLSIISISINILAAYLISFEVGRIDSKVMLKACYYIFYLMVFLGVFNILTSYQVGKALGYTHAQPMFPFLEPSHYALYLGGFSLIYAITNRSWLKKLISLAAVTAIALLIPSTTLLTYVVIISLVLISTFRAKVAFLAFPAVILIAALGVSTIMSNDYFTSRLTFSEETSNLTALVYLQGIQDTKNSLSETNGFGLGLQMMGTQSPSIYSFMIAKVLGDVNGELNREDGGFLAAKIISELGYFGICLVISYIFYCIKCIKSVRRILLNDKFKDEGKLLIFYSMIISFSVELFVRGVGYFSPGVFVFLIAAFYLLNHRKFTSKHKQPVGYSGSL